MRAILVGGVKFQPKWEWTAQYKASVQQHAKELRNNPLPVERLSGNPYLRVTSHLTGKPFRRPTEQQQAEQMAHYAHWMLVRDGIVNKRDGVGVVHWCVVDIHNGVVRFTAHKDLGGYTVVIPNHRWQAAVIDDTPYAQHDQHCGELIAA